jgi:hypothetical protein
VAAAVEDRRNVRRVLVGELDEETIWKIYV